jgi:flagellar biosynthesis/type III secretory pathway M-ring protein FliF/YscJ
MSAIAIIAIIIGALIVLALVAKFGRKTAERRRQGRLQVQAKRDDAQHHRDKAEERRTDAAIADERAKRQAVEAKLHEERAEHREHEAEKS